ncbi:UDP-N-acetylmuramoyl-L-alanyl-D-glutamate--2,6-diaminopimelate ligase [Teredinibacter turnerae]|uniref:UDP-N-acetylmuramoyl-L-alanyl-D-glutamate--2, 6-diaminopimelate ligase n=1 Tax=Teredinibacter turnerae TaxID=2426 RepID=UPI0030CCC920
MVTNQTATAKRLQTLFENVVCERATEHNPEITGLSLDSRSIAVGELFCAVKGHSVDGRQFISAAISRGATAVVADASDDFDFSSVPNDIPLVLVKNLGRTLSLIAGNFYDHPSRSVRVIGVTGTNGKTTCVQLLMQLFNQLGEKAASIGTMGYGFSQSTLQDFGLTTPDAIVCQRVLAQLRNAGATFVAMEVSSHALEQGRVDAVNFEGAVFTNISRDHLDYHGTFEHYIAAKSRLFTFDALRFAVINGDDSASRALSAGSTAESSFLYGVESGNTVVAKDIALSPEGVAAKISSAWGEANIQSCLIGNFNILNLLAVITTACAAGYSLPAVAEQVQHLQPARGRMQRIAVDGGDVTVCVDYAHTPDALEKALLALRAQAANDVWVVFGCGGDRDKGKRAQMGRIAAEHADVVVVTSDNPRTENPAAIIDDVLSGIPTSDKRVTNFEDRSAAIEFAILQAKSGDTVLIAGKGHEDYQIVGTAKRHFDDCEVSSQCLYARISQQEVQR